jgi:pectinesterase
MIIRVAKDGGDFNCIQEAVDSIPFDEKAEIFIGPGVFREKLFCQKRDVTLVGDGIDSTIIDFDDCANQIMEDGSKRGTFRSYTAFFGGDRVTVRNMTIMNSAGDGREVGQAVAVYADAQVCLFDSVKLVGHQDTLFCAPLPHSERQKGGFTGPGQGKPRKLTRQYYRNCIIVGDVDFIFGGADAVFDDCEILVNNREGIDHRHDGGKALEKDCYCSDAKARAVQNALDEDMKDLVAQKALDKDQINVSERFVNGYVTAACGLSDGLGFVFRNCVVRGIDGCASGSVFLGRPWREQARTVFLDCIMDETVAPERFSGWGGITKDEPEAYYGEFGTRNADDFRSSARCGSDSRVSLEDIFAKKEDLPLADLSWKNHWVKDINEEIARDISSRADEIVRGCCEQLEI